MSHCAVLRRRSNLVTQISACACQIILPATPFHGLFCTCKRSQILRMARPKLQAEILVCAVQRSIWSC